jgi:membrane fusion protein, multidrug efflux system
VVNNTVDTNSGTITLQGEFPNKDRLLWPGQFVDASVILTDTADTILVPASALVTTQDGSSIFIAKPDNTVEMRRITVGRKIGPNTVVEKGVNPGDKVVTSGQIKLFPGVPLKIVDQQTYKEGPVSPEAVAGKDKQTAKSSGEGQGN